MIDRLKIWWAGRTLREQRLLLVMAALLAITIAWAGIIRPTDDALADARARHARAVLALGDARAQADAIRLLERRAPPPLGAPIQAFLASQASEAGFTVARIEPLGSSGATLVINAVRAPAFFGWIGQLESRYGLVVDRLVARTNSDATLSVQVDLRGRGR
ncbi:type II secretion system protein GspM [Sphingomonas sp. 1P06PA]|uniref:type II secretion system protein GspM n=1 Tax=Sphingomonas sp. 1P06PA TaxID=554121 RepID=UPI0039A5F5F5